MNSPKTTALQKLPKQPALSQLSWLGLFLFLSFGYLAIESHNNLSLYPTLFLLLLSSILLFSHWYYLRKNNIQPRLGEIFIWAILFRLIAIYSYPILEDDYYRYLWDGYTFIELGNPYGFAPSTYFDSDIIPNTMHKVLDGINNPHIATIYGPVCQWLFALSYLIAPGEIWPLQAIFALFDCGIIFLLSKLATPRNLLLYAWCPLLVKEFAFTAHTDVMAVFFLIAACYAFLKGRDKSLALLLALAVASKVFALLLVPLLLLKSVRAWLIFSIALIAIYLPFISTMLANSHGISAMSSGWFFNAPLYLIFAKYEGILKLISISLFITLWLIYSFTYLKSSQDSKRQLPRGDWIYAAFLFLAPVLNPWYWVWVLPFATIKPSLWAWITSAALLLAYVIGLHTETSVLAAYQQASWAITLEYSLIFIAMIISIINTKSTIKQ